MPDEIVMYIVVNSGFVSQMSKGKLAAQVAHSACKASHYAGNSKGVGHPDVYNWWSQWWSGSYAKIVIKASEFELKQLKDKYPNTCFFTRDEGRTEIPKGSLTTLAFIPMPKNEAPEELKGLKLL